jgi:hypothetical protein
MPSSTGRNANTGAWAPLNFLGILDGVGSQAADPIAQLRAVLARDARLPRKGGLFGGGYARFMAENAPPLALSSKPEPWNAAPPGLNTFQPIPNQLAARTPAPEILRNSTPGQPARDLTADIELQFGLDRPGDAVIDRGLAGPDDGGELVDVINPHHRRLRREHGNWPRDPATGRYQDVAHIKAIADGGTHTLDNVRPLPRAEHIAEHKAAGDFPRWGRRSGTAKAFGGKVIRGFPLINIIPTLTGILSGRIRTDTPKNFYYDFFGEPTPEDRQNMHDELQRLYDPKWRPGDPERL